VPKRDGGTAEHSDQGQHEDARKPAINQNIHFSPPNL
jgi:hypothetical protein